MLILLLFISSVLVGYMEHTVTSAQDMFNGDTLYVGGDGPGNYTKIQDAIDNASSGDTVFVYDDSSPYYENIVVSKSIILIGEDRNTTIIDGEGVSDVVEITADGVTVSNFTIQNSGVEAYNSGVGIYAHNNTLTDNNISNNKVGICLHSSCNNMISLSIITENTYGGVNLRYSSDNTISNNLIFLNEGEGVNLYYHSDNNTISRNHVCNNDRGIYLSTDNDNNTITNNTINSNNFTGIDLSHFSNNSKISGNTISYNNHQGIFSYRSNNNNISGNTITHNHRGLDFVNYSNNTISKNTILRNSVGGILLFSSNDNSIFHNDVIDNRDNSHDDRNNTWDAGYPSGGNYWSDYTGEDNNGDGIGDTPYQIPDGDNQDWYPLMYAIGDIVPPVVSITKPTKALYIRDSEIIPFCVTIIIGSIQIWPYAIDNETGLKRLELYIDDELKETFTGVPRSWLWDERTPMKIKHIIRLTGCDHAGNSESAEIMVWRFF
jgi:parallel beta-helix repeat protein